MHATGKVVEYQQKISPTKMADTLEVTHLENQNEMKGAVKPINAVNYSERNITLIYRWKGSHQLIR